MPDRDDVIERVRKLLEMQVGKGCTEAEAATAYQMASRLLAQHNLTMAEVESHETAEAEDWVTEDIHAGSRCMPEWNAAAGVCREFFFVRCLVFRSRRSGKLVATQRFFGKPTNVETARWVYTSLLGAFEELWLAHKFRTGARQADKAMFVFGVAEGFRRKLREERRAMEAERPQTETSKGTAIVLVGVEDRLDMAFKDAHPDLRSGRASRSSGSRDAYHAGVAEGRNLNLARPVGRSTKSLPGS